MSLKVAQQTKTGCTESKATGALEVSQSVVIAVRLVDTLVVFCCRRTSSNLVLALCTSELQSDLLLVWDFRSFDCMVHS